jgi:hypothetical protein
LVFGCHDHQGEEQRLQSCVHYRRLNDITTKSCFLLQRLDNTLHILARATWFSILDLESGYWQVALYPSGKGRQHSLPLWGCGLCNALETFRQLIESICGPLLMKPGWCDNCWLHVLGGA